MKPPDWLSRCSGFLLAVSLLAALGVGGQRIQVERAQRSVAMLVPYTDVVAVAQAQRTAPWRVLAALRQAGCTGLLVCEDTLSDLSRRALCSVSAGSAFREEEALPIRENLLRLRLPEGATAQRVRANLQRKRPGAILSDRTVGDECFLEVNASRSLIDAMGLGFDPRLMQASRDLGLRLAVELRNYPGITSEGITFTLQQAKQSGADLVLFRGGEVLGYQSLLPTAAQALREQGLFYGTVEFRPLKGEPSFLREVESVLVRVHSVPPDETERLGPSLAAARYLRAVKERNVQALLVRLFVSNRQDLLGFNAEFVERIEQGLHAASYTVALLPSLRAFASSRAFVFSRSKPFLFLVSLGVWAALSLFLGSLRCSPLLRTVLVVSGVAFGAMLLWTEETLGRQALALAAACLFPAYAVSFLLGPNLREGEGGGNPETRGHGDTETQESGTLGTSEGEKAAAQARPGLGQALAVLVKVSLVSLSGGLIIAALLADRCFMLQVEQFRGVKVSLVLPLLWMGLAGVARWGELGGGSPRGQENGEWRMENGEWFFSRENFLLLSLLVAGLGLWLLRSGNEAILPVSLAELRLRAWLDEVFLARPRFKEVLLGYPALILLAATIGRHPFVTYRPSPRRRLVLLLATGVGQVSLVNSFCHAHTPLAVSLLRTFHGLWMGTVVGLGAWGLRWAFLQAKGGTRLPSGVQKPPLLPTRMIGAGAGVEPPAGGRVEESPG